MVIDASHGEKEGAEERLTVIWIVFILAWKKGSLLIPSHPSFLNGYHEAKDGNNDSSWIVYTVTQVEEVKMVIKLIPIWSTCIIFWTIYSQMKTFTIEQATIMNIKV
ncbi:putative nitrate-transporting ATPase [Lupinus albus]|uniref:Putative nitrate-transporting ATPase n=1 Tax=Lupinus albus TaxID=3870 RepID=A0A6A4PY67_LUPAL|nr:putative nitrate-transporting ATPase [Lupinus albus]